MTSLKLDVPLLGFLKPATRFAAAQHWWLHFYNARLVPGLLCAALFISRACRAKTCGGFGQAKRPALLGRASASGLWGRCPPHATRKCCAAYGAVSST